MGVYLEAEGSALEEKGKTSILGEGEGPRKSAWRKDSKAQSRRFQEIFKS